MNEPQTVTIEQAYAEALRALGEAIVMQRLMGTELSRLQALPEQNDNATVDKAMA